MSSETKKSVVYVDASDEITTIITKVQEAPGRIVALVLPKRASALQSIINIRLLKKTADKAKKRAVFITSDKTILPLAGAAGVFVANTPESKPYVPDAPGAGEASEKTNELDPTKPVGELAARSTIEKEETIDLGDLSGVDISDTEEPKEKSKKKGPRIPNFNRFRLVLILSVVALLLLGVGWYVAAFVLPRADIAVTTGSQNIEQTFEFDVRDGVDEVDEENFVIPSRELEYAQEKSASAEATGERNDGDRAEGEVTVTNCEPHQITINSGTALTAANGLIYRSQETVTIDPSNRNPPFRTQDCQENEREDIDVIADEPGRDYNIGPTNYTVAGFSSNSVFGAGDEMEDGTDDIVSIVTGRDIEAARQAAERDSADDARDELVEIAERDRLILLPETFVAASPEVNASPNEGDEAREVNVTVKTVYRMTAMNPDDIRRLIDRQVAESIDLDHQVVIDDGLADATFSVIDSGSDVLRVRLRTIVAVGTDIQTDQLKEAVTGMSRTETESTILTRDGVRDVEIDYSPFYVFRTPRNADKIHIEIKQPDTDARNQESFEEDNDEEEE